MRNEPLITMHYIGDINRSRGDGHLVEEGSFGARKIKEYLPPAQDIGGVSIPG